MLSEPATDARLRVYALMEAVQGHEHEGVREQLEAIEEAAHRRGWLEVGVLAFIGQALCDLVRLPDRGAVSRRLEEAVQRAQTLGAPALVGMALALRAVGDAGRGDAESALSDAGRAVALVDDETLPALERCTTLVICGAAYNALSLWELADELYDRAAALEPACEVPVQAPAIAVNRVLVRIESATELIELGDTAAAGEQLRRASAAAEAAIEAPGLPTLWRLEVEACHALLGFVVPALEDPAASAWTGWIDERLADLSAIRVCLEEAGDVELLPLLDALVALALLRLGRFQRAALAAALLGKSGSASTGSRSFPAWVRAEVSSGAASGPTLIAQREYAEMLVRSRWNARQGMLAAARSRIAGERLGLEHARLSRDVMLDPLTGLTNRRSFDDWITGPAGRPRVTALVLIDVDHFKAVNDEHGHAAGDEVLRRIGAMLAELVRPGDLALRIGGDEFALVLQDQPPAGEPLPDADGFGRAARLRARSLVHAVAMHSWSELGEGLAVRVSVGVASGVLGRGHERTPDDLYREADSDLYAAKRHR